MWKPTDRVAFFTGTSGQGSIAVGAAISNRFFTPAEASVPDNTSEIPYLIIDGLDVEVGYGTFHDGDPDTFDRDMVHASKINGVAGTTKLDLSGSGLTSVRFIASKTAFDELAPKASPTFTGTVTVPDASFSLAKLSNLAGVSVPGRAANSSGVMAAITAAANDRILRRVSDALDFGQVTAGMVPNGILTYAMLASGAIATADEIKAATASKLISAADLWDAADDVEALSDAATIAVNMADIMALSSVTIAGNRTLGNPTNVKEGQAWGMAITASGATRTMAKGSNYKGDGGATFPLSIASGETAYVFFYNWSATIILITAVYNNPG